MTKGERIREIRERIGKSQTAFADAIGVSKQTLYKYENDIITNVPSDKIELMAELTGVSPGYIMGWEYVKSDFNELKKLEDADVKLLNAYHAAPEGIKSSVRILLGLEERG